MPASARKANRELEDGKGKGKERDAPRKNRTLSAVMELTLLLQSFPSLGAHSLVLFSEAPSRRVMRCD